MTAMVLAPPSRRPIGRSVVSAVVAATGLFTMVSHTGVRALEARVGAAITGLVTGTETIALERTQAFIWSVGTPDVRGLQVTAECTAAFVAGPLLIVAGAAALSGRIPLVRIAVATSACLGLVAVMVALRLGLIGWSVHRFGADGYRWSHTIGGSVVSIVGVIAALVVFVRVAFRDCKRRPTS